MTVLLLGLLAFVAIRFVLGRLRAGSVGPKLRPAGADAPPSGPHWSETRPVAGSPAVAPAGAPALPPGFDAAAFEKIAKLIFIRLQAANDAGDLNDLRAFTTPEMFAAARLDLQNRVPGAQQQTDVVQLAAEIVDYTREAGRDIVSVRYSGLLREQAGAAAEPFDEVWHLVRDASDGNEWRIAGIQQSAAFA
jgi:predicted lipid-binding transport protein (Tim44 family)